MKLILWQVCVVISFILMIRVTFVSSTATCTKNVTYTVAATKTNSHTSSYDCGWWGWSTCHKTTYSTGYITKYMKKLQCCSGYGGEDCLPICNNPNCTTNMECTKPQNCSCITGWEGSDCLTDINECSIGNDTCEDGCTNTNGSYSCYCSGGQILANDNEKCLGAVKDVTVKVFKYSLTMTWSPPVNYSYDGTLAGYKVSCDGVLTETLLSTTSYTVPSLDPFTSYECCIKPYWNKNGEGPSVCKATTTLEDAPSDTPHNITMIAGDSESMLIEWSPPLISNGIITHYNIYINYTNGSDIDIRYTTDGSGSTLYLLEHLDIYQLVGVSISATTIGGQGPQSPYIYNRSGETEPDAVHYLKIEVLSNTSANISWHPPLLLKGVIIKYHLTVRNLSDDESMNVLKEWTLHYSDLQYTIEGLEPFVPYEVGVAASTSVGKGDIIKKIYYTIESVPSIAPVWSLIDRESISIIKLAWTPLTLEESRGFVTNYTVRYTETTSSLCVLTGSVYKIITNEQGLTLSEVNSKSQYCVSIAGSTTIGTGLYSQWSLVDVYETITVYFLIDGIHDCEKWSQQNTATKSHDFSTALVTAIQSTCQCAISTNHIYRATFRPCADRLAVLKVSMFLVSGYTSDGLLKAIMDWVNTPPHPAVVAIDSVELTVIYACTDISNCSPSNDDSSTPSLIIARTTTPIRHEARPSSSSDNSSSSSSQVWEQPQYISPAVAIIIAVALAIVVVFIIIIIKKKRKSSALYDLNQPHVTHEIIVNPGQSCSSTNPCYETPVNQQHAMRGFGNGVKANPTYKPGSASMRMLGNDYQKSPSRAVVDKQVLHQSSEKIYTDMSGGCDEVDYHGGRRDSADDYIAPCSVKDMVKNMGTLPRGLPSLPSKDNKDMSSIDNIYEHIH